MVTVSRLTVTSVMNTSSALRATILGSHRRGGAVRGDTGSDIVLVVVVAAIGCGISFSTFALLCGCC